MPRDGSLPSSPPIIVCVLPEPVWPYAIRHTCVEPRAGCTLRTWAPPTSTLRSTHAHAHAARAARARKRLAVANAGAALGPQYGYGYQVHLVPVEG
jgi:hypothetical protein